MLYFEKCTALHTFWAWARWEARQLNTTTSLMIKLYFDNISACTELQTCGERLFWAIGTLKNYTYFQQYFWFYYHATRGLALSAGKPCHGQRTRTNRHSAHYTGAKFIWWLEQLQTVQERITYIKREKTTIKTDLKVHAVLQPKKKIQVMSKTTLLKKQAKDKLKKKIQKQKKSVWA